MGPYIRTAVTCFSFKKPSNKVVVFKDHDKFHLTLKLTERVLSFQNIFSDDEKRFEVMRVINSGVKQIMKANKYLEFGIDRKYYDSNVNKIPTEEINDFILKFMQGFKTTIELYRGQKGGKRDDGTYSYEKVPKLLVDCCSRIVRGYNLYEEYEYFMNQGLSQDQFVYDYIEGKSFLTTYGNQRIYRVDYIDSKLTSSSKFPNDKFKTYEDYFKK